MIGSDGGISPGSLGYSSSCDKSGGLGQALSCAKHSAVLQRWKQDCVAKGLERGYILFSVFLNISLEMSSE